jgi:hypothetical protein
MGISTSHASEDEVVLVEFVDVLLLVVAVAVVAWDSWMTVITSPWARQGSEGGIKTAKVKSSSELILKCDIPPGTGEQPFLGRYAMEPRVKALSDRPDFSHDLPMLPLWSRSTHLIDDPSGQSDDKHSGAKFPFWRAPDPLAPTSTLWARFQMR